MRKNKLFIAGLVTVFVALVSLTLVSSTWAKYTSDASGSDSARVAYWGFGETAELELSGLFAMSYNNGSVKTVQSGDLKDVIAPGTSGSAQFKFDYKDHASDLINEPEVNYSFVVSTDGSECDPTIIDNSNIIWSLGGTTWGTWNELLTAIEALDGDQTFEAGELPENFDGSDVHEIYWQWKYNTSDAADEKDTLMGNTDSLANVKIVITITATQID